MKIDRSLILILHCTIRTVLIKPYKRFDSETFKVQNRMTFVSVVDDFRGKSRKNTQKDGPGGVTLAPFRGKDPGFLGFRVFEGVEGRFCDGFGVGSMDVCGKSGRTSASMSPSASHLFLVLGGREKGMRVTIVARIRPFTGHIMK